MIDMDQVILIYLIDDDNY